MFLFYYFDILIELMDTRTDRQRAADVSLFISDWCSDALAGFIRLYFVVTDISDL